MAGRQFSFFVGGESSPSLFHYSENYYSLLGIASFEKNDSVIQAAYDKAILNCHPNHNPHYDPAEFALLKHGYKVLTNPTERVLYDAQLQSKNINTSLDPSINSDMALAKLNQFFELLFQKRGTGASLAKNVTIKQRQEEKNDRKGPLAFLKPIQENFQRAKYYLELNFNNSSSMNRASSSFLNKLLSQGTNAPMYLIEEEYGFSYALTLYDFNFRDKTGRVQIDIFLHDAKKLDLKIAQLQAENPLELLATAINKRLQIKPRDRAALAADKILKTLSLSSSIEFKNDISFLLTCALNYPTDSNVFDICRVMKALDKNYSEYWQHTHVAWENCLNSLNQEIIRDPLEKNIFFKFLSAIREKLKKHPKDPCALIAKDLVYAWKEAIDGGMDVNKGGLDLHTAYQAFINPSPKNLATLKSQLPSKINYPLLFSCLTHFISLSCLIAGLVFTLPWLTGIAFTVASIHLVVLLKHRANTTQEDKDYLIKEKIFDSSSQAFFKAISQEKLPLDRQEKPELSLVGAVNGR